MYLENAVNVLRSSFNAYYREFLGITRRAKWRFELREWASVLNDAEQRIGLYHHHLNLIEERLRPILGPEVHDHALWDNLKNRYAAAYIGCYHADIALIYFYSVMRRFFVETGESIEYSDDEIARSGSVEVNWDRHHPVRIYPVDSPASVTAELIRSIVDAFGFAAPFRNLDEDAMLAADLLRPELERLAQPQGFDRIEVLKQAFFRNKSAYLMGRIISGERVIPMVLVLLHPRQGIVMDCVLTAETDLSNIFSSARSNFHTDPAAYREVFQFLETIAPTRPMAYVYSSIGFIHPGKLQLVKELRQHIAVTKEKFHVAQGVPGTVMMVFTLPTFRYVFKVIRDVSSKETFRGRRHVVGQYWRVHRMDRVGRMLDIFTFHNLRFQRSDFDGHLLEELLRDAQSSVRAEGDEIVFRYLYAARQVTPLDVYLADPATPDEHKRKAVVDYGYGIKDLASAGIFVGDYMPKNFGVNRLGRVILYDYDDLADLVAWNFRKFPEPPEWADTMPASDWLSKDEWDVFPEHDFRIFTVPTVAKDAFIQHHEDLLTPAFWNTIKRKLLMGIVPDFREYPEEKRVRRGDEPAED